MDCIEGMKQMPDNSVDSIVTDPPYELGFMGKKWDSTGIAYNIDMWKEALRVLKPGGHLLAFGGTRTYHRMTCAIEDAGFEIRDCIQWLYGSGFPKSMNISKAIDKQAGAEREVVGKREHPTLKDKSKVNRQESTQYYANNSTKDEWDITIPSTDQAQQWEGWGTALKPANEPIVVARKPLSEKTIAENVLKWGTGGINIDECRIPTNDKLDGGGTSNDYDGWGKSLCGKTDSAKANLMGRFPANVIFDEEAGQMLDEQSGISKSTDKIRHNNQSKHTGKKNNAACYGKYNDCDTKGYSDIGGASRFFYCAKAGKSERGDGNNHPTVKPLKLIEYLINLVTPPNGITLDPFSGSATTTIGCINTKKNYICFENNKEYFDLSEDRVNNYKIN